ncbi:MAG: phosphatase PAP2 family protein [Clostridia bacterium]|nr:phosphatase PAP2 family protein [Clostridia bacterium]
MSAAAAWLNSTFAGFDHSIFAFFHSLQAGPLGGFFSVFFKGITILGEDGLFLIFFSLFLMLFKKTRKAGSAMLFGVIIGAVFTNVTIKPLVARPRPYVWYEGKDVWEWWKAAGSTLESEFSFPSGHTTAAMSAMTGLFFVGNRKYSWTAFIFAVLMGMSRVFLCVHFPSDILGGFVIGFVAGLISSIIVKKIYDKYSNPINQKIIDFDIIKLIKK